MFSGLKRRSNSLFAWNFVVCFILAANVAAGSISTDNCIFPRHLWHSSSTLTPAGRDVSEMEKQWTTQTMYRDADNVTWWMRREIVVKHTHITVKLATRGTCFDTQTNTNVSCARKDLLHRIVCLTEEPNEIFRVLSRGNGVVEYYCMKFVARGRNVFQVWSSPASKTNEDHMCHRDSLQREMWPWIIQRKEQWSFCPFTGGFDFRVYIRGKKARVCKHQWRPSRLESECVLGEGIHVQFPDTKCTVLDPSLADAPLHCWGGWMEGDYIYAVIGRHESDPQYTLRLPKDSDALREFTAELFNAPVAPLLKSEDRALEESNSIRVASLQLMRSDAGVCYDESELCPQFSRDGKCVNSALHKFANFCKKSCGLCGHKADLVPSVRSECFFPDDYRGRWLLFETDRQEDVIVDPGHVTFTQLGSFICKSKHWRKEQYKTLSVFTNGCRPRYSCMHFRLDGSLLYFQLSRSSLLDRSFDLCEFRDDPEPLRDKIRSRRMKLLLPESRVRYSNCGLNGVVPVNVSFPQGDMTTHCDGTLSDWNPMRCHLRSSLSFTLRHCRQFQLKEYRCVALIDVSGGASLLITQDPDSDGVAFQCWVVQTYSERMSYRPWKQVYVYDRGQCGTPSDVMALSRDQTIISISTLADAATLSCVTERGMSPALRSPALTSPRPDLRSRWPPSFRAVSEITRISPGDFRETKYLTVYQLMTSSAGRPEAELRHRRCLLLLVAFLLFFFPVLHDTSR